jgi:23S rRNA G2445 N2-methylase RlmL
MAHIKELFKRSFDVFVMKNWLRHIEKELELAVKYNKKSTTYENKSFHHRQVAKALFDEYCKLYPEAKERVGEG